MYADKRRRAHIFCSSSLYVFIRCDVCFRSIEEKENIIQKFKHPKNDLNWWIMNKAKAH